MKLLFSLTLCFFSLLLSMNLSAQFDTFNLRSISAKQETIRKDLDEILLEANFNIDKINFSHDVSTENSATVTCESEKFNISIKATEAEWSSVLYFTLQKMGFLFPHPRNQISPNEIDDTLCGKTILWKPALKYRGFHFHTMHPNEWVHAFLMGNEKIAEQTIKWLARNQQNVFDFNILKGNQQYLYEYLQAPFQKAKDYGIHAGISFGIALHQQNNWQLVSILGSLSDKNSAKQIDKKLPGILQKLDISYLGVELGTSEFTSVNYQRTIDWLNQMSVHCQKEGVQLMAKVHISSNQENPEFGNFNFVPQYCEPNVGILPHTVFYYALEDEIAPMYGNENFKHMKDFLLQENGKRMNWFYPETSYYINLDIDIPFLHLDYLRGRSKDTKFLYENKIEGQLIFTTGHELAYWMIDWTVCLLNNLAYNFDPLIALKLLGEDAPAWEEHLKFHEEHFTNNQLVQILTFENGGDELMPKHRIHNRNLIKELSKSATKTLHEIEKLEFVLPKIPSTDFIKNRELKIILDISYLRIHHALHNRKALLENKKANKMENLEKAKSFRLQAQKLMDEFIKNYDRYPEAQIFEDHNNPTAYPFGYGKQAADLYLWQREEQMILKNNFSPFFMKVYKYLDIVF